MADKTKAFKTKSVYFAGEELKFLDKIVDKCKAMDKSISDYFKELAAEDLKENKRLPKYMEDRMIELIKQYAPMINTDEVKNNIKDEFDSEAAEALSQFENF